MDAARKRAEALFLEANQHIAAGELPAAEVRLREAVLLSPQFAQAYANLGLVLERRQEAVEAEACYRQSMALNPDDAQIRVNFGAFLAKRKRFSESETAYRRAIELAPRLPQAWSNLGALNACLKREDEAERCYRTALELDGSHAAARFNLGYVLLRQGRFDEGWRCLEARDWYVPLARHLACPRWQGEPLAGKTILIGYEAGHGDMIQFGRYAAVLKARGAARITMICHPALKALFRTLDGVDSLVSYDEQIPSSGWDFWTPLLSIPFHCGTRIESIPAAIPYLRADPEGVAKWRAIVPVGGIRVGLVWKGNPRFENDADRSIHELDLLVPLGNVEGVNFLSLQKGAGEDEATRPPAGLPLTDLGPAIGDFADSAAVLANLDLVISVDTAIGHLAAALGKPCWVLLPDYMTDWRWLTGRTDSPWYPGVMRLFRQSAPGDWAMVIEEVTAALRQFVHDRRVRSP